MPSSAKPRPWRIMPPAELSVVGLRFLDGRLRTAVQAAAAVDDSTDDSLRGLYISDEQALSLAGGAATPDAEARIAVAGERLGVDALDLAVLTVCAAPELHPRYGFLYAYLQDDVTRRLASPRLVADLLEGEGTERADVLSCFGVSARLSRIGALRLLAPDGAVALADRPVKVADRLAAFLLGAGGGLAEAGAPAALRRVEPRPSVSGRHEVVEEVARLLEVDSRLTLMVCGPDAAAIVAAAAALDRAGAMSDATLAAALEQRLLCVSGLDELAPTDRARLLAAIDETEKR